ncbi:hypothetical protein WOLCODRAFT_166290 [Wolfiporia cocos MD-104 SS10]|uniref:Uncharacterized protein n=1 Tax=Wolfiporia cocos (strain MD-104) TaxID=742152 RepID=A0A2H3IZY8_WOLCO|nr:hypothetical protein WOLCODRAFT_166290 [Wolfiporia cocos MD-104 SS10]
MPGCRPRRPDVQLQARGAEASPRQRRQWLLPRGAKDPAATYKVLWYRLSYSLSRPRRCKADILVPGVMDIPDAPRDLVRTISELPVMPLALLLFLKLQSWTDHRDSPRDWMRPKQNDDVLDISRSRANGASL